MNSTWKYLYKTVGGDLYCTTNLLYTPTINPEQTIMCMHWDSNSEYQKGRTLTNELIDFFFKRELDSLIKFQGYSWTPKLIDTDFANKKIYIEWNIESLNHIVTSNRSLEFELPDWKDQIYNMLADLKSQNYIKAALYPHCFFIGSDGNLKTIDFYSCIDYADPFIEFDTIKGMIGDQSLERFTSATTNGMIDFRIFFKDTMLNHLAKSWDDNPFPEFYRRLYD